MKQAIEITLKQAKSVFPFNAICQSRRVTERHLFVQFRLSVRSLDVWSNVPKFCSFFREINTFV